MIFSTKKSEKQHNSNKSKSGKNALVRFIFFFLLGVVFPLMILIFLEFALYLFGVKSNYELKESGLASVNIIQTPITMMISDPILGWRIKPDSSKEADGVVFANNSYGFRGNEINEKKGKDVFRIICFGDSSTYGVFVTYEDIYSEKLEEKLDNHFRNIRFEVINAGILGYSTFQILALFEERIKALKPDLIIVSAGINDAAIISEEQLEDSKLIPKYGESSATYKYYGEHSRLVSLLSKLLFRSSDPLAPLALPKKFDRNMSKRRVDLHSYRDNLVKICEKAEKLSSKAAFLAFSLPPDYQKMMKRASIISGASFVDAESSLANYYRRHRDQVRAPASRLEFLMMTDTYFENILGQEMMKIRRDKMLFVDNCHPNAAGHSIVADSIFRVIINDLLIYR